MGLFDFNLKKSIESLIDKEWLKGIFKQLEEAYDEYKKEKYSTKKS